MNQPSDLVGAREAADLLGVKLATLYAYASRGLVRSVPGDGGRARRYAREDLARLRARRDARAGHGPVAAAALHWGEAVLETAVSALDAGGPRYRGRAAVALAAEGVAFESVAELLWAGALPPSRPAWPARDLGLPVARLAALVPRGTPALPALALAAPALALRDGARFDAPPEAEHARARALLRRLAACLALGADPARVAPALRAPTVAGALAVALAARGGAAGVAALDRALVLAADHELNASTFAARVAASAGADLYACVGAALAALSGPRHGGACDRVEALVAETAKPARAAEVVAARARRGEAVPGFGHPLYPDGDPRAAPLLALGLALGPARRGVRTALALVDAMRAAGREAPTLDTGLVALAAALGLPPGAAAGVFAVGRAAGWIAHALEQRAAGVLLRPRARYVGPEG